MTAKEFAGNWMKAKNFGWHNQPEDAHLWGHYVLFHRDSQALDRSNGEVTLRRFRDRFEEQEGDSWNEERHSHWAVGHVTALTVRALDPEGNPTPEAELLLEIIDALEDYPILDEDHFSSLEYEEALETLQNCYDVPEEFAGEVWGKLQDQGYSTIEEVTMEEVEEALSEVRSEAKPSAN